MALPEKSSLKSEDNIMKGTAKRIAGCMACVTLTGTLVMGCGAAQQDAKQNIAQETAQETQPAALIEGITETTETEAAENIAQLTQKYEDNFAVDSQAAKEFAENVKEPVTTLPTGEETPITLETLLGENYVQSLTETITMQMGNRMDKKPDVRYYPIADHAPLGNYVTIGEETQFEVDEEGCLVITFPAGTVTDEANGVQEFRIQRVATGQKG